MASTACKSLLAHFDNSTAVTCARDSSGSPAPLALSAVKPAGLYMKEGDPAGVAVTRA
jgi:hypothetical protein